MLSGTPDLFEPHTRIAGIDEAGRGPLAGPVVAAAVVLCKGAVEGLDDSKKLSPARRAELEREIKERCAWAIGIVDVALIDRVNILGATMLAMTQAMDRLELLMAERGHGNPVSAVIDGNLTPAGRVKEWRWAARAVIGGDASHSEISAASILAKECRDRLMREAAIEFPAYGWDRNKGYGTREHLVALRHHGPCPLHRRSFAPVAQAELRLPVTG